MLELSMPTGGRRGSKEGDALSASDKLELTKLLDILEQFRVLRSTMPVHQVCALLRVAIEPGEGVNHYMQRAGVAQSVMSRHLLDLADTLRNNEPGMELLTRKQSPISAREAQYFLSSKGRQIVNQILSTMRRGK